MGKKAYIEINGRKYDVATGKLIEDAPNHQPVAHTTSSSEVSPSETTVDAAPTPVETPLEKVEVAAKPEPSHSESQKSEPIAVKTTQKVTLSKPSVAPQKNVGVIDGFGRKNSAAPSQTQATAAGNPAIKKAQKSQTLMRQGVPRPQKVAQSAPAKTMDAAIVKKSSLGASQRRQVRSQTVGKSAQIRKFNAAPVAQIVAPQKATAVSVPPVKVLPPAPSHSPAIVVPQPATRRPSKTESHIEKALANAQSHTQKAPKLKKRSLRTKISRKLGVGPKAIAIGSSMLSLVIVAGFISIQNVPNLAMRVAATRAGFAATMPGYRPSGYSFKGPINYADGRVVVTFASNTDDRSFDLVQSSSNWNSDALLANFIIDNDKQYQTFVDKGRTLYIYDGSNATWIDDGIWYQIEGSSNLSADQLVRIASSI